MNSHYWNDPHMMRTGKSMLKAVYISLGVFLFAFVLTNIGGSVHSSYIASKAKADLEQGIKKEMDHLKILGDELAKDSRVIEALTKEDSTQLTSLIDEKIRTTSITGIGVTNNEGIIIGRTTKTLGVRGDNVFLTTAEGRVVAKGESVENIGAGSLIPTQVRMVTGRLIMEGDQTIGALFASILMDDKYATRLRDTGFQKGVEISFYNKQFGIYGNSFSDKETRKLITSYFNSGSDWIQNGLSGKTVFLEDGTFYMVENIVFSSLEGDQAGALIFIPRNDISAGLNLIISLLTLCTFLLFAIKSHFNSRGEEHGWRYYTLVIGISIPIIVLSFFALQLGNSGYTKLKHIPYLLYNSTLRIQPDYGIYDLDFEQKFLIIADTGDESINAVEIGLNFDPRALEVKSFRPASSTCSYVIENKIDTVNGKINFSCVLIKSGGERGSLPIAELTAAPKQVGTFILSFNEDTKVLANDGLGTNVLRMSQAGSYRADNFDLSTKNENLSDTKRRFVVFSHSHPNQSKWYNDREAKFIWKGTPGAVYAYEFDSSPDTIPSKSKTLQDSTVSVQIPGDGIFYFHLQLASGGPIAHYRIQSDITPPTVTSIDLSSDKIVAGDVVRLSFQAEDITSGIQNNYYIDLGNHLFLPMGSQIYIPFVEPGNQKITLRVYDGANNYSEISRFVQVEKP